MSAPLCVTVCVFVPRPWQVTKRDLEQRHPQLEDIFTLAQNIKNKTSNLDVRTSITEKRMSKAVYNRLAAPKANKNNVV